jgi:DNA-binding XRE family transcriptional regulator
LGDESRQILPTSYWRKQSAPTFDDEEDIFRQMYDGFSLTLMKLIDEKGLDDVECYKKANVSRQTWHKILNDPRYKPNKKTILSFAIALELNLDDTQRLLATAGFILSKSSKFDLIIMYCIVKEIYDVFEIDAILFQYDQETLSSRL